MEQSSSIARFMGENGRKYRCLCSFPKIDRARRRPRRSAPAPPSGGAERSRALLRLALQARTPVESRHAELPRDARTLLAHCARVRFPARPLQDFAQLMRSLCDPRRMAAFDRKCMRFGEAPLGVRKITE